jgi:hypothetical protein
VSTSPPAPSDTDAAAFMAELRRLKAWSGLSYRQLERRAAAAGHSLPYSTAATLLGKDRLPRAELVVAFVTACGVRGDDAQAWADARSRIVCGPASFPPARSARPRRSRRSLAAAAAVLVAALLGAAVAGGGFTDTQEERETRISSVTGTPGA